MKKKKIYESPYFSMTQIEVESAFASGSVINEKKTNVNSLGQDEGTIYDAGSKENKGFWDDPSWI